jgi:hypothetical protein
MSVRRWLFTHASLDACTADGTFSLNNTDYDLWSKDSVFAINMRLGSSSTFAGMMSVETSGCQDDDTDWS